MVSPVALFNRNRLVLLIWSDQDQDQLTAQINERLSAEVARGMNNLRLRIALWFIIALGLSILPMPELFSGISSTLGIYYWYCILNIFCRAP